MNTQRLLSTSCAFPATTRCRDAIQTAIVSSTTAYNRISSHRTALAASDSPVSRQTDIELERQLSDLHTAIVELSNFASDNSITIIIPSYGASTDA